LLHIRDTFFGIFQGFPAVDYCTARIQDSRCSLQQHGNFVDL
jgi:hypothetical protein